MAMTPQTIPQVCAVEHRKDYSMMRSVECGKEGSQPAIDGDRPIIGSGGFTDLSSIDSLRFDDSMRFADLRSLDSLRSVHNSMRSVNDSMHLTDLKSPTCFESGGD